MRPVPPDLLEEITERLRQALKASEAAELVAQDSTDPQARKAWDETLSLFCGQAVSLERVAAMLGVIGAICMD